MEKNTGKTSTGFEFSYDKRILSDWGYVTLLTKMTSDDTKESDKLGIPQKLIVTLLGEEQTERLIQHIRDNNDGFAPVEEVIKEFKDIIELKN